jgi:hypothetical protein
MDLVSGVRPVSPASGSWKAVETRKNLGLGGRGASRQELDNLA